MQTEAYLCGIAIMEMTAGNKSRGAHELCSAGSARPRAARFGSVVSGSGRAACLEGARTASIARPLSLYSPHFPVRPQYLPVTPAPSSLTPSRAPLVTPFSPRTHLVLCGPPPAKNEFRHLLIVVSAPGGTTVEPHPGLLPNTAGTITNAHATIDVSSRISSDTAHGHQQAISRLGRRPSFVLRRLFRLAPFKV